jgi:hypothetical protein
MKYLVRETTEVDSVYHVGLFKSLSDALAYIDLFAGTACESWKREVLTVEQFIPDFVPVEDTQQ